MFAILNCDDMGYYVGPEYGSVYDRVDIPDEYLFDSEEECTTFILGSLDPSQYESVELR